MRYLVTFVTLASITRHLQTGRTVHDAFLGGAGKVPEDGGEAVKGFEEIGEAPF